MKGVPDGLMLVRGGRPTAAQEALVYLSAYGPAGAEDVGRDLAPEGASLGRGVSHARGSAALGGLRRCGLACRMGRSAHALTERGRLAAALVLAFNPAMLHAFFDDAA